jgi:hypothetical protein
VDQRDQLASRWLDLAAFFVFWALSTAANGTIRSCSGSTCISRLQSPAPEEGTMNGIIYLVGLIVVIMFILSFLGLR